MSDTKLTGAESLEFATSVIRVAQDTAASHGNDHLYAKCDKAYAAVHELMADRDRLTAEVLRLQDAVMESDARGAAYRGALENICRSVPATDGSSFVVEHYTMGGEYLGAEQIDPMLVVQQMGSIASAALSPATSTGSEVGK